MNKGVAGWRPVSTAKAIKIDFTTSTTIDQLTKAYATAYDSKPEGVEVTDVTTGESYHLSILGVEYENGSGNTHNIQGVVLRSRQGRTTSTAYKGWALEGIIDIRRGIGWFTMEK